MSNAKEDVWTVLRLITWTTDYLRKKGSESPRLDAEVLLAHVLKYERVQLYVRSQEEVAESDRATFRELVKKRSEGAPVAYLVGKKEFYSLSLQVSPAVLIPRPDSEFVVMEFLTLFKGVESPRALDIGTGSGCLAIACAQQHKNARFIAVDLSENAIQVARSNAKTHEVSERVEFRHGTLFEPIGEDEPFDAILSNPPYIRTDVIPRLEAGVRDYEPHLALDGGEDGLRVVEPLIAGAISRLKPGGHLILEIGSDQELPVRELIASHDEYVLAPTIRDHSNHPRVIRASRKAM